MSKHTPNSEQSQLSIFDPTFDSRIRRVEIDGVMYFSVLDVFQHYGKAKNPTQSWRAVLKHLENQGFDRSTQIVERPVEGGGRPTPFATFKTMLRIAQVTDFREWEYIRQWMADTAHEELENIVDPELRIARAKEKATQTYLQRGKSAQWARARLKAIDTRQSWADTVVETHETHAPLIGVLTNATYRGLTGQTKDQIAESFGLNKQQYRNFRDVFSTVFVDCIQLAENAAATMMKRLGRTLTTEEQQAICLQTAQTVAPTLTALSSLTGETLLELPPEIAANSNLPLQWGNH